MSPGNDPLEGTLLAGRYRITSLLAAGGMGVVYRAVQEPLGRTVAVKVIQRAVAADPTAVLRFEREARVVSGLSHPNVVTVHDFGKTEDGGLFLAMELVHGRTLRQALQERGQFSWTDSLAIVRQIAAALAHAHAQGLVHRDLKPENVMLVDGEGLLVKVLDFGLAKPTSPEASAAALTVSGGFVGTPGYVSPEQMDGAPEHGRQDLYGLGVIWWEMLAGEHPFRAPTPTKMLVRQLQEAPVQLAATGSQSAAGVPALGEALVVRLFARDPETRPVDARAVLRELEALGAPSSSPVLLPPPLSPPPSLISSPPPSLISSPPPSLISSPPTSSPLPTSPPTSPPLPTSPPTSSAAPAPAPAPLLSPSPPTSSAAPAPAPSPDRGGVVVTAAPSSSNAPAALPTPATSSSVPHVVAPPLPGPWPPPRRDRRYVRLALAGIAICVVGWRLAKPLLRHDPATPRPPAAGWASIGPHRPAPIAPIVLTVDVAGLTGFAQLVALRGDIENEHKGTTKLVSYAQGQASLEVTGVEAGTLAVDLQGHQFEAGRMDVVSFDDAHLVLRVTP